MPVSENSSAAGQLGLQQVQLQQMRVQLRSRAEGLGWQSPAASAFGDVLGALLSQLGRAESLTGELLEAMQRHSRTVRRREREIASAAAVVGTAAHKLSRLL